MARDGARCSGWPWRPMCLATPFALQSALLGPPFCQLNLTSGFVRTVRRDQTSHAKVGTSYSVVLFVYQFVSPREAKAKQNQKNWFINPYVEFTSQTNDSRQRHVLLQSTNGFDLSISHSWAHFSVDWRRSMRFEVQKLKLLSCPFEKHCRFD